MLTILIPVIICLVGLVLYSVSVNSRAVEIGRIMFAFGLFFALLAIVLARDLKSLVW